MQISCKVNVVNRLLPATGQSGPNRFVWANVTLSRNAAEKVELSLATSRNKSGTKYRVTDNLEQVFAKFVSQGKMTVRFKQPQHDLCFTGEARHLEKVAHILKGGDGPLKKGSLSASMVQSTSTAKLVIPKTKLTILSRADYPVVTNFPDSLVSLKPIRRNEWPHLGAQYPLNRIEC